MATILLSSMGMAAGGAIGGSVLGLETAVIGRAIGAAVGRRIDEGLTSGRETGSEGGPDRFRLSGASEGQALAQVFGQARVAGSIIWATEFSRSDDGSTGGKGGGPTVDDGGYRVSLALALCEGEITRVGRIWAEGTEIAPESLAMRVYHGSETQMPDPLIEAVQGAAPAYRGTAYVVIEALDLARFGNRVPSFSFEVIRPSPAGLPIEQSDPARFVEGVALIPGSGEYSLAERAVYGEAGFGESAPLNVSSGSGGSDFATSLEALNGELPNCGSVSLVVSWFGTDLRCGACRLEPRVEPQGIDAEAMPWVVSGIGRAEAEVVPSEGGAALYGGTPTDQSVIEAIRAIRDSGKAVLFYPFILMAQTQSNTLTDPWTGQAGQPHLPWRGRITTSLAPGYDGSPDNTAAAGAEVAAFLGTAEQANFTPATDTVVFSGDSDWGYRRFILHYAHLCALAGGVDAFCIGSEMRALTQVRDGSGGFPFVDALRDLAADVRAILGPECKISYAADWSEYHGYQPVGTGDKLFHLDPLWADANIDFIGIDNYMPLSDWREETDHLDAGARAVYNLEYLRENVAGGELFDWYYHSTEARAAQIRTGISDHWGDDWVWRTKDLKGWWRGEHRDRVNGALAATPSPWVPESKPIWFTELGCPAVHLGTNQPNVFVDPKSSESSLPYYSDGSTDPFIQTQYLKAVLGYYALTENNPVSEVTGQRMVAMDRCHVWAWDARPFPAFPMREDVWSDAGNYRLGHWINGRASARGLAGIVAELCQRVGVSRYDVSRLYGQVTGYVADRGQSARAVLEALAQVHPFDVVERDGTLVFQSRTERTEHVIEQDGLVELAPDMPALKRRRGGAEAEAGALRLTFWEAEADYATRVVDVRRASAPEGAALRREVSAVLSGAEAYAIAEHELRELEAARETVTFALPPSRQAVSVGDLIRLTEGSGAAYQVVGVLDEGYRSIEARATSESSLPIAAAPKAAPLVAKRVAARPVQGMFLDLPLLRDDDRPHAPWFGATNTPWPGSVALWSSDAGDDGYRLTARVEAPALMGVLLDPLPRQRAGIWDRGAPVRIRMVTGHLSSVSPSQVLSGGNVAAIGDGDTWEVLQYAGAALVGPNTYALSDRLRGQAGSDAVTPEVWPAGSYFVRLDARLSQVPLERDLLGVLRDYRFGPEGLPLASGAIRHDVRAFAGVGLRPYRVCHLEAAPVAEGYHLKWIRRTRLGGDSWAVPEVPLAEEREQYQITVLSGDGGVLRNWSVTAPEANYTAEQIAEDGVVGSVTIRVAQVSAYFGAGPEAEVSIP